MQKKILNVILYAEDEADIREIAKIALEDVGGFTVVYCNNGREVLTALNDLSPDLILLDVMMPEMDGPTTLQEIQKQFPHLAHIPIIFMTAKVQSNEIEHYKKIGALEIINKPFDPMQLAEKIKQIWENAQANNVTQ